MSQIPHLGKVLKYLRLAITEENRDTFEEVRTATGDNERLVATFLFEEALYTIAEFYRKNGKGPTGLIRLEVNPRGLPRRFERMEERMGINALIEEAKKLDPDEDLPGDEWKGGGK